MTDDKITKIANWITWLGGPPALVTACYLVLPPNSWTEFFLDLPLFFLLPLAYNPPSWGRRFFKWAPVGWLLPMSYGYFWNVSWEEILQGMKDRGDNVSWGFFFLFFILIPFLWDVFVTLLDDGDEDEDPSVD